MMIRFHRLDGVGGSLAPPPLPSPQPGQGLPPTPGRSSPFDPGGSTFGGFRGRPFFAATMPPPSEMPPVHIPRYITRQPTDTRGLAMKLPPNPPPLSRFGLRPQNRLRNTSHSSGGLICGGFGFGGGGRRTGGVYGRLNQLKIGG